MCGCGGKRRAKLQGMSVEEAQLILDQQAAVNPLTASTIVDPNELVQQP